MTRSEMRKFDIGYFGGLAGGFIGGAMLTSIAMAQAPAPPGPQPPANVTLPFDLVQALVNAGQSAPGNVINPLTDKVRQLVNEQMGKQQQAAGPPLPEQPGPGAPVQHSLPEVQRPGAGPAHTPPEVQK